ncbi:GNAT family N-acetyltransferase [Caenispirillum bisanense]|uniref:Putative acetyltransferase n=1 Tax=Caenispirillum bisanense TaxID=414052 RepID=A0A286GMV2_9PROT|nr:GNAT family N-acetyltransferase [Caenispirillum bisanense]SOD96858.1 putative acetyltransferase [Caenispirillum bisanense]
MSPSLHITVADPREPAVAALVLEWLDLSAALTPAAESRHAFAVDRLADPRVTFFAARDGDAVVGCGALYRHDDHLGEVKSMYVRPSARGRGIARMILARVEEAARAAGLQTLSLETGASFTAALTLYESAGFVRCGPFAAYRPDPLSAFLTKPLAG